jgi:hypothetical protein
MAFHLRLLTAYWRGRDLCLPGNWYHFLSFLWPWLWVQLR